MEDIKFKVDILYGSKELRHFYRYDKDGWLVFYGYSITRDKWGNEISRTKPTATAKIR